MTDLWLNAALAIAVRWRRAVRYLQRVAQSIPPSLGFHSCRLRKKKEFIVVELLSISSVDLRLSRDLHWIPSCPLLFGHFSLSGGCVPQFARSMVLLLILFSSPSPLRLFVGHASYCSIMWSSFVPPCGHCAQSIPCRGCLHSAHCSPRAFERGGNAYFGVSVFVFI